MTPLAAPQTPASSPHAEPERRVAVRPSTQEQLDERVRFEALLTDLSAAFVKLPADAVDGQIEDGLRRIVEFLGVDRSSFGELSEDRRAIRVTHSYVVPGF